MNRILFEPKRVTVHVGVRIQLPGKPYANEQWNLDDYAKMILLKTIKGSSGRNAGKIVGEVIRTFVRGDGYLMAECEIWVDRWTEITLWHEDSVCGKRISHLRLYTERGDDV